MIIDLKTGKEVSIESPATIPPYCWDTNKWQGLQDKEVQKYVLGVVEGFMNTTQDREELEVEAIDPNNPDKIRNTRFIWREWDIDSPIVVEGEQPIKLKYRVTPSYFRPINHKGYRSVAYYTITINK